MIVGGFTLSCADCMVKFKMGVGVRERGQSDDPWVAYCRPCFQVRFSASPKGLMAILSSDSFQVMEKLVKEAK